MLLAASTIFPLIYAILEQLAFLIPVMPSWGRLSHPAVAP
jgi:hypothetical protein